MTATGLDDLIELIDMAQELRDAAEDVLALYDYRLTKEPPAVTRLRKALDVFGTWEREP